MLRAQHISKRLHSAIVFLRRQGATVRPNPWRGDETHRVVGRGNYRAKDLITWARDLGWNG